MSVKLIKAKNDLELAKYNLILSIKGKKRHNHLFSSLIIQSINGFHIKSIPEKEEDMHEILKTLRIEYEALSLNLIWNDLPTVKKKYKKDALDRIYLVSLSTILKNGTQSISWFSLDSLKEAKSKNILTIGLSNSLLHIIDL